MRESEGGGGADLSPLCCRPIAVNTILASYVDGAAHATIGFEPKSDSIGVSGTVGRRPVRTNNNTRGVTGAGERASQLGGGVRRVS